tara:strand:+ start:10 stop:1884 length:1875 start_codon:yes stop_codon:yes gene_type:complete
MSTLTELNSYSNNTVTFTDNRQSEVVFDYPTARNIPNFVAESSSFVVQRKIDIDEIIDPNGTLNLTYSIDLSSVPGATLTWTTLFNGAILSEINQVYSVRAIDSIADWDFVKAPTITLPVDFQGSFEYTCTLTYLSSIGVETKTWTVGTFVPVVNLSAQFTQTASPTYFKGIINQNLTSSFTLLGAGFELDIAEADFASSFNMVSAVQRRFRGFTTSQFVTAGITASGKYLIGGLSSSLSANATVTTNATKIDSVTGYNNVLSYTGNAQNANIFNGITFNSTTTPVGTNHRVVITVSGGQISRTNLGSTLATVIDNNYDTAVGLDGATQVQGLVDAISFFPTHNSTSTATYSIDYYINGTHVIDGPTTNINYSGTTSNVIEEWFVRTNQQVFPSYSRMYHNKVDFHLFGGGGGGANSTGGGGGGAGNYETMLNQPYVDGVVGQNNSGLPYNLTIGTGGNWGGGSYSIANAGAQGTSTVFVYDTNGTYATASLTIEPGYGGGDGSNGSGLQQGSNTQGTSFTGGLGFSTTINGTLHTAGGQGAGATADGTDAYTYNNGQNFAGGTGNNGKVLNSVQYAQGGKGQSTKDPTFRSEARTMGSGGNGGANNVNGRGADGGAVIRTYRT